MIPGDVPEQYEEEEDEEEMMLLSEADYRPIEGDEDHVVTWERAGLSASGRFQTGFRPVPRRLLHRSPYLQHSVFREKNS